MSMKIGELIDKLIEDRARGNPAIAEMTRSKLILKGFDTNKYELKCCDEPEIVEKLIEFKDDWNYEIFQEDSLPFITAFSHKETPAEVVLDIHKTMSKSDIKVLIYFAAPSYDQDKLSRLMDKAFAGSIVFGCSSAGEKVDDKLMTDSVVALGLSSKIAADAKVEVLENLEAGIDVKPVFKSFSRYFNESAFTMDVDKYVGIVLIDGLSRKEERVIDEIGNATNVSFVGGSAGDYLKFEQTLVYANGKCYDDVALIALIKLQDNVGFSIANTQSFKATDACLLANKVDEEVRQVIEFNHRPAAEAYADALGISVAEISEQFFSHPVGLVLDENNILVRSPRHCIDSKMEFSANILEGMTVSILEADDIIQETKNVIENIQEELGDKLVGIISFDCIYRRLELADKQLTEEYGEIFKDIPSIGLCSYGEVNIGFMNQASTMLILKYENLDQDHVVQEDTFPDQVVQNNVVQDQIVSDNVVPDHGFQDNAAPDHDFQCNAIQDQAVQNNVVEKTTTKSENSQLKEENLKLHIKIEDLERKLEQATQELRIFNRLLEKEIHERTNKEEYITYISYHDELTGLYNRRYYEQAIIDIDKEDNLPISIILGDVNNLKIINDTLGHEKGDELLVKVADVIKSACRQGDIIARVGGDEFVVLLPNASNADAEKIARRIENLAESKSVAEYPVSISIGWATKDTAEQEIDLFNEAEIIMYINKAKRKQSGY